MNAHPDREALEGFLRGTLPNGEIRAIVFHLMQGCRLCGERLEPMALSMFHPGREEVPLTPEQDEAYDRAIASACSSAIAVSRERQELPGRIERLLRSVEIPQEQGFWTPRLCEALLDASHGLRHTDPAGMLRLARLAQMGAERIDPSAFATSSREGSGERSDERFDEKAERSAADLRSRSWAELANAYRVSDDLTQATDAMARAVALRSQGTGDPHLLARLADLGAALAADRRRFGDAFRMLDAAYNLYERLGLWHDAGRMLVTKGLYAGYTGDPGEGVQLLAQGLAALDRERDSRLVFQTLHNILLFRVELGQFAAADRQLRRMRLLYARHAGAVDLIKLRGIEGKIAAGLGNLFSAEAAFREVRHELDRIGLGYQAALISLDLAAVCQRLGKTDEVRRLAVEMAVTFRAVGVEREAMAAVLMLREAAERDQVTLELVAQVAATLQRVPRGAGLTCEPEAS
jgi:hypothetical protein